MTPEDRQRIEALRALRNADLRRIPWVRAEVAWLLELVERQEAALTRMTELREAEREAAKMIAAEFHAYRERLNFVLDREAVEP